MARILIVEDDVALASAIYGLLERVGHDVEAVHDGQAALHRMSVGSFDLVLLDTGLPSIDGLTVLRRLREDLRSALVVIVISRQCDLDECLAAFRHGADDYVVKPFALEEIAARVKAFLRRISGDAVADPIRRFELLQLDTRSGEAAVDGAAIRLPPKAALLLDLLLRAPGQVVRRRQVEQLLWPRSAPNADALRRQVHCLRKALAGQGFDRLETVRGVGYRLRAMAIGPVRPADDGRRRKSATASVAKSKAEHSARRM